VQSALEAVKRVSDVLKEDLNKAVRNARRMNSYDVKVKNE
jgi:hypothetical protein